MKRNSLDLLACPACRAPLTLHNGTAGPVESGRLRCEGCQKDYPIEQGIPHFVQPEQLTGLNRRFSRMYDLYSWGYRAFSKIAFAYIGMSEETGRREITDWLEPRGGRVVGVDISEKMIEWSRLRAMEEKVEDKVEFRIADVLDLPFEDGRFNAVIVESVLAFVEDKPRAIRECIRVTKPGGYIGLNESFWTKEPSPEMVALVQDSVGSSIPTRETWQALWEASGLRDRTVSLCQVNTRSEIRDRLSWVGRRWALRGLGRMLRLSFTSPGLRQSVKKFFGRPSLDTMQEIGYGLFTGKK